MSIKIGFSDFWSGFDLNPVDNTTNNFFYNILSEKFDIEISDNPKCLDAIPES